MTLVKYADKQETFLKAICYNSKLKEWEKWRPNLSDFTVFKYLPSTKSNFYTECVRAFNG